MFTSVTAFKSLVALPGILATDRKHREGMLRGKQVAELISKDEILNLTAMVTVTDANGVIIYANDLFCQASGFTHEEILGRTHEDFYHRDTPSYLFTDILETVKNGKVWRGEIKNRTKDDGFFWVMNTVAPIMGPDNKPEKFMSVRYDISRQKKMEEMLDEYRAKSFKDLYDNVQYAGHIHRSIMPNTNEIKKLFSKSFVTYIPKNVIGGDFFWFSPRKNHKLVALGDSTGHGVSASLISSLAVSNLINIIEEMPELDTPSAVLKVLNKRLARITKQNKTSVVTESSDIAFLDINTENNVMTYASGKTRMVLLRNKQVIDLKKDNGTIGGYNNDDMYFTDHQVQLQKGDRIFLYSDGYIDQFGGRSDKRLGSKRLRAILEKTAGFDMDTQEMLLREYILHWKGEHNQTDDISMIGVEI